MCCCSQKRSAVLQRVASNYSLGPGSSLAHSRLCCANHALFSSVCSFLAKYSSWMPFATAASHSE